MDLFANKQFDESLKQVELSNMEDDFSKEFNQKSLNEYNKIVEEQKDFCFNIFSEEEAEQIQSKGKMDFLEVSSKHKFDELAPYWGSGKAGIESISIYTKLEKLKKGEILSEDEKKDVKNYLRDMAECELRGHTLGGNVAEGIYGTVPFLFEAGIGFATAEYGVGLGSLAQTGAKFALRKGAKGYAKKEIRKALIKENMKKLAVDSTLGTARFTATKTPTEWIRATGDILISDELAVSERGKYILNEGKTNPAKAVMLGLGETMIENFSETSGAIFGVAGKAVSNSKAGKALTGCIHKNVLDRLPKKFTESFTKLVEKTTNLSFTKALNKYGYHGIIEEMGEERIGGFLRGIFNLDDEEGYSFETILRSTFPSKEQLAVEGILFGLIGGGTASLTHGIKKTADYTKYKAIANEIKKETLKPDGTYNFAKMKNLIKKNNPSISNARLEKVITSITEGIKKAEDYTLDDFLIDAEIMKTPYKRSITENRLREILSNGNISDEEVETIINFASKEEQANLVKIYEENQKTQEDYSEIKKGLVQSGRTEEQANYEVQTLNKIDEVLLDKYNDEGQAEELIKNRNLKLNLDKLKEENTPAEETSNYEQVMEEARLHTIHTGENTRVTKDENGNYSWKVIEPETSTEVKTEEAVQEETALEEFTAENTEEFAPEEKPEPIDKYEDFGEVIHGAKKELWQSYQKVLQRPLSDDFEKISLKDFPEPNYEHLIREGVNVDILATIKALRDCIPTKPRGKYNSYKRKEYITVIKFVRELASEFISGEKGLNDIEKALEKAPEIKAQVDLYIELGYPAFKNANDLKLMDGVTVFYKDGKRLEEPLKNQYCFAKGKQFIGKFFNTREEAIEYMRGLLSAEPEKQEKKTKLDIYQVRKTGEIIIGKKVGTNKWIDLKGGFTNSKDARAYYQEHEAELLELLKKRKETPETRHTANRDRIGEDYREGMNITPEKFANEFGFRGVQFGNYVEQKKRVQDINEAYDALLDLANLLDVPSRALSLNGSLGIAFGARGSKGAKAHYEPVEVVINLTKQKGAGSLAHEWWHALDNYFAKKEGVVVGHITDRHVSPNVRKEVFEAFKNVAKVVSKTMYDRSSKVDVTKTKDYWSTTHEMTARAFEAYIIGKAKLKGFTNDYLANILTEQEYTDIELYPYPLESEMAEIIEAYDNLFKVLKTEETEKGIAFYQSAKKSKNIENEERAKIEFKGKETIITLAKGNDASSFMHELAHLYLHDLQELAKVNKRAEKDLQEVYKMLDFDGSADYTEEQFREMHEKFARSFEAYLMNGQAPTEKMKSVFEKFKEFLQEIYHSLMDLEVEFSNEIKQCFDRLFTTDEEYENEVLPMYQQNEELAEQINQQDTLSYKIKNNMNALKEMWKSFYDTAIIPFDTRLEKITPELKKILRKHTFDMTIQSKKDCDKITPFLLKIKEIKQNKTTVKLNDKEFNAYNLLSFALNNRDSYTVNKVVKELGIQKEFGAVRELLDDLHEQAQSVGLEVGYLESYYPRMVQTDKTDAFVEMFERIAREEEIDVKEQYLEAGDAEYSNVKRQIAEKDTHGLWNNADKAKLINTSIRGFGKNNILLSRIGQLKFERLLDKLTPEQQRFYEPIEKALSNYVIGARKNIEERKFFGAENKEVSKLRASIKKKRETLRETKTRTPAQAKWKEMNRLKYELAPIEIKLESISGELKNNQERVKTLKDEEERAKVEGYIATQKETIKDLQERAERLKSQLQWVEENNALKVKNVVVKRLNQDLEDLNKQINEILGSAEHVEDSIGRLIVDLAEKGIIHVKDERAVRDILVARFNQLRIEKFALGVRDVSTIVTLNDITNALTQITDLTFSAFKFGLFNTIEGMKKVEGLTREDLGIKNIAEEFRGASALSKWLNLQLKIIGLDLIDGFAKNTAINASVLSARKKAKAGNKKFDEKLKYLFGERAEQVKKDLIEGKMTDEITFIAFNDLADIQPITTDQMTGGYQSGFKPFYVLKTYSIKALDILRNECFSKISSGIRSLKANDDEGKKLIAEGIGNLIKLQLFMWLFGLPQDLLKDLIANKEFDIPEHVIDNIIIFGIFNRYLIKKTSENPANIYLENVKLPALQAVGDLWTGIQQVKKGKKKVENLYVWSRVPVVGKIYYNWFGGKKNKRVEL